MCQCSIRRGVDACEDEDMSRFCLLGVSGACAYAPAPKILPGCRLKNMVDWRSGDKQALTVVVRIMSDLHITISSLVHNSWMTWPMNKQRSFCLVDVGRLNSEYMSIRHRSRWLGQDNRDSEKRT